jgi:predicted DNA-binding transcriptional regulator YafY
MSERGDGNAQAAQLLSLITHLQASSIGRTIPELMAEMECSRRTVVRLLEELQIWGLKGERGVLDSDHHLTKRYTLRAALPAAMLGLSAVDRAALESLLDALPGGSERVALSKLLAAQSSAGVSASVDQETLIERVAYLGRVGPKAHIAPHILTTLERGIQGFEHLTLVYRTPQKRKPAPRTVEPLGLIYSRFGYLVARQGRVVKTFRMELIESVQLTGEMFDARGFNLKAWAAESFGIYHGDELKTRRFIFSPRVANRAKDIRFHPSEQKIMLPDGSLLLILRCRGERELLHELQHPDWAGEVQLDEQFF